MSDCVCIKLCMVGVVVAIKGCVSGATIIIIISIIIIIVIIIIVIIIIIIIIIIVIRTADS